MPRTVKQIKAAPKRNLIWSYNGALGGLNMAEAQLERLCKHPLATDAVKSEANRIAYDISMLRHMAKKRKDQEIG